VTLSRDDFLALAREHTVVPVWREVTADLETPVSAFAKLVGDGTGFLLESVEHGERWGRFSFLGRDPALTVTSRGTTVEVTGTAELPPGVPTDGGVLLALEALLSWYRAPQLAQLPPFHGGFVGYLGYDVAREIERLPGPPRDDLGCPDALLMLTRHVVAFDHFRQRCHVVENVLLPPGAPTAVASERYDEAMRRLDGVVDELGRPLPYDPVAPPTDDGSLPDVTSTMPPGVFQDAVAAAREYILAGDIFQVVLAQRFDLDGDYDPFEVYRVLRQVNPSPYMYLLRHPEVTIAGSSPEALVKLVDGRVISRPIAGTRWRGRTEKHDAKMAAELMEHPKERAEHVMLVDLARNDVGRVVRYGTERVDELMQLERYSHVMHLTSQVSGELADGCSAVDVMRATFPAGTLTGAPKVRAMEIIDELEPARRGPYAGVVGYFDLAGNLDTAIAIRTMVWSGGRASVGAGAGVVADSDPDDEELECHNKARALLAAAAASRRPARAAVRSAR